jgi:shikimate kinase
MIEQHSRRIVITGFMGAGKTSTARALARRLDCMMLDLDEFITSRNGISVPEIIKRGGVRYFRQVETEALRASLKEASARIISLGGGAWAFARNRALITSHQAFTVWLDASFDLCWQRISSNAELRPLARDFAAARKLYHDRLSSYALADLRVRVSDNECAEQLAAEIAEALSAST